MKFEDCINTIVCGDCLEVLRGFPAESINCCISSPPYWALRDYGVDGQLGLEPTFEEYIDKLCGIYDEVKRVLRKDGTCWVNLGDTYGGSGGPGGDYERMYADETAKKMNKLRGNNPNRILTPKSLCLIPQRFAIEMVNRGWILRNVIIWHKPNPMPSSTKDRFTVDFEYVFFFVKNKKYWFEPQYEPHKEPWRNGQRDLTGENTRKSENPDFKQSDMATKKRGWKEWYLEKSGGIRRLNPLGRNKRTVWTIPTQSFSEAHFATFPEKLVEPMILSGCPEFVCKKCGMGRRKIYDMQYERIGKGTVGGRGRFGPNDNSGFTGKPTMACKPIFKGYTDCGCNARWRPGIVLDMFRWQWNYRKGSGAIAA